MPFETCMECGNTKLSYDDCMSPHCVALRKESSAFYDEIDENDNITIGGATMIAGLDF